MDDATYILAKTIANEAGVCGVYVMIAVAWVYSRNPRMTGTYGPREPGPLELWVASNWWRLPDYSMGASFVFSDSDLEIPAVQEILRNTGPPRRVPCRYGLGLNFAPTLCEPVDCLLGSVPEYARPFIRIPRRLQEVRRKDAPLRPPNLQPPVPQ